MKTIPSHPVALLILIPALMLMAGCNNNSGAPTDSASATNAATAAPDNSAKNTRDQSNATLTPLNQGNAQPDLDTTANIRKAIVSSTNNFSMTAKNVKIITVGGKVTLRGPVQTDGEKSGIEAIAKSVAGDGNVDDQLEIKANQ